MTLRLRLLLGLLVVNLGLLAAVQWTSWRRQEGWLEENRRAYERVIAEDTQLVQIAYGDFSRRSPGAVATAATTSRRILDASLVGRLRTFFRDVLITSGRSTQAAVDLNPIGAVQRDWSFPIDEIRAGIRRAMGDRRMVQVESGFCLAMVVDDEVVGGAWFQPKLPPPVPTPMWVFAVPLLIGTLLFALLADWFVGASVFGPLRELGDAARRVGEGRYDARMRRVEERELDVFIDAFNAMAQRIEGHHGELEREVSRATDEAQRKERAMLQSGRLAAMGTLAAGIAHEINNPIGGMLNALRRFEKRDDLDERDQIYLQLIRDGLERVGGIARRVLDFSPKQFRAEPFGLADAVDGARGLVDHRLKRQRVEFRVAIEADMPALVGDRHEFQQVLLNLFLNSLDVLDGRPGPGWIEVRGRRSPGGELQIEVEDNGPGMPTEDLDRVVDPFYSAKGRPEASGLGMFISYSIVRNHGGELELDSSPGQGFRVRIRLPEPQ